jgi:formate hydrogenlyase transcriptional activator
MNELTAASADDEDRVLRALMEGTSRATGQRFFESLVRHLAQAVDAHFALVAEFSAQSSHARTLGYFARDRIVDNFEWDLRGTPCEQVYESGLCHFPTGVSQRFSRDEPLVALGIDSYLGVPLIDEQERVLGHLAVFDERPMPPQPRRLAAFRIFAARAAAELERIRAEQELRESEARHRDLYEEAPVAYLSSGIDGRFRAVNARAAQLLGYAKEELVGAPILSFFADSPAGKTRAREVFAAFLAGQSMTDAELELVRKDRSPLWVSMSMKPMRGPDGAVQYSRSVWIDITDRVLTEAENARLKQQNRYLQDEIKSNCNFEEIIGSAAPLRAVLRQVEQVAPTDSTVLILGETGTGKELIARAIHERSRRRNKPFVKVNCAALPQGLVESELFGHEKGAFTGAIERRLGRFALANGGTIFLDEIGEMPLEVQVKLLRVLQEHEFEAIGATKTTRTDVRVVAATHRDLGTCVATGMFRADLFYRLNVFPIAIPSLRARAEDIPLLAEHFVAKYARLIGRPATSIGRDSIARLVAYRWPGNIRELENVIERAVILSNSPVLEIDEAFLGPGAVVSQPAATGRGDAVGFDGTLADGERRQIRAALRDANWVIEGAHGAAMRLGLHPNTLRSRMKRLGIRRDADARGSSTS